MLALRCTQLALFDVDDTLIKWRPSQDERENIGTECQWKIRCLSVDENGKIVYKEQIEEDSFIRIEANIEQLKEHKRRGHTVAVWSAGGWQWAEIACKMLGIEDYVDFVFEKPKSLYDDKQLEEFMPKVQFMTDAPVPKEESKKSKRPIERSVGLAATLRAETPPAFDEEDGFAYDPPTPRR